MYAAIQSAERKIDYLYNRKQRLMISRNDISTIRSLQQKKFRIQYGMFVAEGPKLVGDLCGYFHCRLLVSTQEWLSANRHFKADRIECVSRQDLEKTSLLTTPQDVVACFSIPHYDIDLAGTAAGNLVLVLDNIQDPGNIGTIARIADWFGIRDIVCSKGTADIYNPKAVQATMGALARVRFHYTDLEKELSSIPANIPVYGTFLDGKNMYRENGLKGNGIIVMGNEGNGISPEVGRHVSHRLFIPNWPEGEKTSESLNVAVATAIICAEFRRPG